VRASRFWASVAASVAASVMAVGAGACGGGDGSGGGDEEPTLTTAAAPTTTAASAGSTVAATGFTLRVTDIRLVNSEEPDSGMRILLPAGVANATVSVRGLPSPNRVISVCQARELDSRLSGATCRMPQGSEEVTVALGSAATGVELVQVGTTGPGEAGNSAAIEELTVRYTGNSRELRARLPQIAAGDAGGRPAFALSPASSDGAYRALLTWTVIPVFGGTPSNATLDLLQGGTVANSANSGSAQVELRGSVTGSGAALRVSNTGGSALVTPKLTVVLP